MNSSFEQIKDSPFKANGRFGRLSFAAWSLLLGIIILIMLIVAMFFFQSFNLNESELVTTGIFFCLGIVYIIGIYLSLIFVIRRLHDKNLSGWFSLLNLVPLVNIIFITYLICAKGDETSNRYGIPRATQGWEKVLGWIYIILVPITCVLGIFAAMAIPAYQNYVKQSQQIPLEQNHQQSEKLF